MSKPSDFRVIICGGGIAGLTLANSLQSAEIDYIILEARDQIAPQVGASIGMFSHGGRILDQLGLYDDIVGQCEPAQWLSQWNNGKLIGRKDSPQLLEARSGYPIAFGDRQMVLQCLYEELQEKDRIILNKRVSKVDHSTEGVTVHCKDGTTYDGGVVIGADGVHSIIRHEMWRQANLSSPGTIPEKEMDSMISEYSCVYGISAACGLTPGEIHLDSAKDKSALVICGQGGRTFWFFFEKMDKKYSVPNIPKWTKADAEKHINANLDFRVTDQICLGDIWKTRLSYTLVSLEEALFTTWAWGRFACLGDSIHKMTPNIGQGGNNAIESAAALANTLKQMISNTNSATPTHAHITSTLQSYQKRRALRIEEVFKVANMMTRVEALKGFKERLLTFYIAPNAGDFFTNLACATTIGAEKLEYLPDTERSLRATMPFSKRRGLGQEESLILRALIALPLLFLGYYCHEIMLRVISQPKAVSQITKALTSGSLPSTTTTLAQSYYGSLSFLDSTFRPLVALFSPALLDVDPAQRSQLLSFLVDISPIYYIWTLESSRRANALVFARFPLLFGLAFQLFGIGSIAPLYYFLHYVQSPMGKFASGDQRLHQISYVKTALPALIIAYLIPTFAMFFASTSEARLMWNAIWQPFPLLISTLHYILANYTVTDTTRTERLKNPPTGDLKHIRFAMTIFILVAACTFNYVRFSSPFSLTTLFLPPTFSPTEFLSSLSSLDMISGMSLLLKTDHLSCFLASFIWLALLYSDLKKEEMLQAGWINLALYAAVGMFVAGPGAVVGAGWWAREEILASRPAKGAVVRVRS